MEGQPNKRFYIIVIIILIILNIFSLVSVWVLYYKTYHLKKDFVFEKRGFYDDKFKSPHEMNRIIEEELKFDESQKVKFNEVQKKHITLTPILMDSIKVLKRMLVEEVFSPSSDSSKIDTLVNAITTFHRQIELQIVQYTKDLKSICNPSQSEKLKSIIMKEKYLPVPPFKR
ncbi:MAG: hypothetical protein ACP5P3_02870 [Ignavibacteria bacterium]